MSFHFLHLTFQEYLAALHLVKQLQPESNMSIRELEFFRLHLESEHLVLVSRFCLGIYTSETWHNNHLVIRSLINSVSNSLRILALCHCAFEAGNEIINKEVLRSLKYK